ncbi:MAG TPA: hypothetical protein VK858_14230 [Longimicrobiales bacterium]|nr:hypothetical protein [Longimicrobiales bacterium]
MADFGSRRGATNLGVPLMLVTFLLIGGFMYWLYITAEPTEPVMVEEVDDGSDMDTAGSTAVDPQELKTGAEAYTGQLIRLQGLAVSQMVGQEAFFVDLPATAELPSQPFLVRLSPDLAASGATVAVGDRVTVVGSLMEMTDSIVADWVGNALINANEQMLVEFSTHFVEADQLNVGGASGGGASSGS